MNLQVPSLNLNLDFDKLIAASTDEQVYYQIKFITDDYLQIYKTLKLFTKNIYTPTITDK